MFIFFKSRLKWIWIAITVVITALILVNSTIYFRNVPTPNFLLEKGELRFSPLWRTAFYFHVIASCVCLATGPFLMIPKLIGFRRLHAVLGYAYLNAVLWVAAPTGLIISPVAKGGPISAAGFFITGLMWWYATWLGYRAIRHRHNFDLTAHICWMVRSYAIALSAVAFRVIQQMLAYDPFDANTNYTLSVWLSLVVSLWISETCIHRQFKRRSTTESTHRIPSWFSTPFTYQKRGKEHESLSGTTVGT